MPTLVRLLAILAVLGGVGYATIYALATLVEPTPREMKVTIPASPLQAPRSP